MKILISAGEASGELYGAQLIATLRRRNPGLEFFGVGGDRMRAAGCQTVVDVKDLAVVGITEILSHLPKIYRLFRRLIAQVDRHEPGLAVVIDSPAFNWRVARQMYKRAIPVVYYVCPQFWAWRVGRVKLLRRYVTQALVIFPFEEKFYGERGVDTTFVGHPLADLTPPAIERGDYAHQHKLDPEKYWITLMPGSRVKEVRMNLPILVQARSQYGRQHEFLLPVAPTLDPSWLASLIGDEEIALVPEALPALRHSRAAIVASGTATIEAALMLAPFLMVYRVSPLTYALGRGRIKVPYLAMVNLIAGEAVVPELVQHDFTVEKVVGHLNQILPEGRPREQMLAGLKRVRERLRSPHQDMDFRSASERAADVILRLVNRSASP